MLEFVMLAALDFLESLTQTDTLWFGITVA